MMGLSQTDICSGLNGPQKRAVTATEGPVLIVAGPGTGKTLTIVRRIAYLIHRGVSPESILAVTFTNRAAREMRERVHALLGEGTRNIFIGTFHLLGLQMIRDVRAYDFVIYDRDEQIGLLRPLVNGSVRKARQTADSISRIKNFLVPENPPLSPFSKGGANTLPSLEESSLHPPLKKGGTGGFEGEIKEIFEAYQTALRQRNAFDFDDLILTPLEMLEDDDLTVKYRDTFKYIIVDEYQDINTAQYRLLNRLVAGNGNICAVGDSDQAIYAFRGADIENFLNFEKDFSGATRITLSENYRSTVPLLRATNHVIKNNRRRIDKELKPVRTGGAPITIISVPDDRAEGETIIREIEARMGGTSHYQLMQGVSSSDRADSSYRFSDFAVIYRTNAQAKAIEEIFLESGIPYQVVGRKNSALNREIEETLAYLKSVIDPDDAVESCRVDEKEAKLLTPADFFDPRADAVALLTMHMAKGLEFRAVFIAGCEDGLIPCTLMKDGVDIEEERRLFYVGMTRAKDELFLVYSRTRFLYGQRLASSPSPFLGEIPEEFIERTLVPDRVKKLKEQDNQLGLF